MTAEQPPTPKKKPASPLMVGICCVGAAAGLYVIGAVLLVIDGTNIGLFDAAPPLVQAVIKFAYEPLFMLIDRIFPS